MPNIVNENSGSVFVDNVKHHHERNDEMKKETPRRCIKHNKHTHEQDSILTNTTSTKNTTYTILRKRKKKIEILTYCIKIMLRKKRENIMLKMDLKEMKIDL